MDTADRTLTRSTLTAPANRAPRVALPAGTVLAGRFTLLAPAGQGGMGIVYRARDEHSGRTVALKLLHAASNPESLQRFGRESELLAALRHPGIVAHVAHGLTEQGHPFLAMEWLEGEDLARRLKRAQLDTAEALALVRRAAEALALAHQHGIVHRDLKPSNLFLRHGRPEDVVLLDFGLARHASGARPLTSSHAMLGTPGYMAPEQVSAQGEPTLSADLFSLGCVLYECLTGQPPFGAPHFTAVLAKILFAEPAPLRSVRPQLPEALQPLVDRLLAKEPQARLPNARALLEMLDALEGRPGALGPQGGPGTRSPARGSEQQLVSVLLATLPLPDEAGEVELERRAALCTRLREQLAASGAQVELLAEGGLVATLLPGRGTATDQAALAARCALYVQELWPEACVGLATGLGTLRHALPVGEAMDKAGQLLRELEQLPACVLLDEVTAGLLGPSFQLTRPAPHLYRLHGEQLGAEGSRRLLGRPVPCVGREQELATLELAYATCVEEPSAQALLVVAPAGMGKSRLLHELLHRLEQRERSPLLLFARGDAMSAGSACGLLGQALRRLCGVSEGEELSARQEKLAWRLCQHLPAEHTRRTLEFLGELCHVPFSEEHSPRLRAARGDPKLMGAQVAQALVTFLRAECQQRPVLLVLEDLQWGDAFAVRLVDEALRELAEQPLMVLALARPEVKPLFPGLWARCLQELPLRGLGRKACARLVREVLGEEVPHATVERLCEQSGGNALFLEELIRQVAEGRGEAPPETVLAMLQARLLRLEPEARQVLLAASLFGRSFWARGVQALLPGPGPGEALAYWLQRLVELELIEPQSPSHLVGEAEYRFRQELMREAAYGLVPEAYKQQGHARVGAWLERAGESEPRVLAEHALLAQEAERSVHFLTLSAEQHLERNGVREALLHAQAALEVGPQGQALSRLRALRATAAFWQGDFSSSYELGRAALPELEPGSVPWCRLAAMLFLRYAVEGQVAQVAELGGRLAETEPVAEAQGEYVEALSYWCAALTWFGAREEATAALARRAARVPAPLLGDALVQAWGSYMQGLYGYLFLPRPWQSLVWAEEAMQCFRELGAERQALLARMTVALCREVLGDRAGAVAVLREGLVAARQTGQPVLLAYARFHLGLMLAGSAERAHQEEARVLALRFAAAEALSPWAQGMVHAVLARAAALRGEWAEAEAQALRASERLAPFTPYALMMRAVLATALLGQGRAAEAREVAALGVQVLEGLESEGLHAVGLRLVLVEACLAQGDTRAAEPPLRRGLECLLRRARDIPEGSARERFLQLHEHARVLALARQRWGEAVAS